MNVRPNPKQMQIAVDRFNAKHAVGDTVRFWTGPREGAPKEGRIRFEAQVMGGHTAVVYVEGVGSIALSHVEGN